MRDYSKFRYVYCMAESGCLKGFKIRGMQGKGVYEVPCADISAVASDTDKFKWDASEENVKTHERVSGALMQRAAIVPVAFGMVFKSEEALLSVLERGYAAIKNSLCLLGGKVELGVKVIKPSHGEGVEAYPEFKKKIIEALGSEAVSSAECRLFSDRLLMNMAFLTEKNKLERFSQAIENLEMQYPQFKIHYTGPWPPYNFVTVKIGE